MFKRNKIKKSNELQINAVDEAPERTWIFNNEQISTEEYINRLLQDDIYSWDELDASLAEEIYPCLSTDEKQNLFLRFKNEGIHWKINLLSLLAGLDESDFGDQEKRFIFNHLYSGDDKFFFDFLDIIIVRKLPLTDVEKTSLYKKTDELLASGRVFQTGKKIDKDKQLFLRNYLNKFLFEKS